MNSRLDVTGTRSILSNLDEYREAVAALAKRANRTLSIYTPNLEPQIYDHDSFLEPMESGDYIERFSGKQLVGLVEVGTARRGVTVRFPQPEPSGRVPLDRVVSIGNAACAGAEMILLNKHCREAAGRLARSIEHVEIALDADFEQTYAAAMAFPARTLRTEGL